MYITRPMQSSRSIIRFLNGIFAILTKIHGNVSFYLLCAPLTGMRFRFKRYFCWHSLPRRRPGLSACAVAIHLLHCFRRPCLQTRQSDASKGMHYIISLSTSVASRHLRLRRISCTALFCYCQTVSSSALNT
jgi:hypothetical protein